MKGLQIKTELDSANLRHFQQYDTYKTKISNKKSLEYRKII